MLHIKVWSYSYKFLIIGRIVKSNDQVIWIGRILCSKGFSSLNVCFVRAARCRVFGASVGESGASLLFLDQKRNFRRLNYERKWRLFYCQILVVFRFWSSCVWYTFCYVSRLLRQVHVTFGIVNNQIIFNAKIIVAKFLCFQSQTIVRLNYEGTYGHG